ncbi:MAG: hypothetical protein KatS3mg082_3371 [Nitrospiraceae bacterium]|nr:MAG: hypothetical protein KatS3mg051_1836 [Anaerolineae bacterium]GIW56967.1 MAG: hypothetical protein KatS3mg082_3371 [Nitrospiraceae bacterium]
MENILDDTKLMLMSVAVDLEAAYTETRSWEMVAKAVEDLHCLMESLPPSFLVYDRQARVFRPTSLFGYSGRFGSITSTAPDKETDQ